MQVHRAGDHLFPRARFALNQHGGGAGGDARQELVHLEHRGTLPDQRILPDGVMCDFRERDGRFARRGAQSLQCAGQVVAAQRQGQHVQHPELLGAERQSHRRCLRGRDQSRAARGGPQGVDPPRQLLVRPLAQGRQYNVPSLTRQETHRSRQIRRRVHLEPAVVRPLAETLQQGPAPRALAGHDQNPQAPCVPLPQHGGQR